jgi:methyl coenzyme M reductase alpha subunit
MTLGKYVKTPAERKNYSIDFEEWLNTGETVTTFTYSSTPVDATPAVIDAYAIAVDGLSVGIYVSGGIAGTNYKIDVIATTSTGQIKEDVILFSVRDV